MIMSLAYISSEWVCTSGPCLISCCVWVSDTITTITICFTSRQEEACVDTGLHTPKKLFLQNKLDSSNGWIWWSHPVIKVEVSDRMQISLSWNWNSGIERYTITRTEESFQTFLLGGHFRSIFQNWLIFVHNQDSLQQLLPILPNVCHDSDPKTKRKHCRK